MAAVAAARSPTHASLGPAVVPPSEVDVGVERVVDLARRERWGGVKKAIQVRVVQSRHLCPLHTQGSR